MTQTTINKLDQQLCAFVNHAFSFLVLVLPFIFCWLSDELFEFNKMMFVYGAAIIIGGAYLARMIVNRRLIWQKTVLDWPIALFLLSQVISTIFSLHPRTSLIGYYTRLNGSLLSTIAYITLFYSFVNNVKKESRANFISTLFFSGILASLYAIFEHFGHSFSCLIIKGNFDVSCWIQDVQTRVFASFGQPNWLAAYNVTLIGLGTPLLIENFSALLPAKKASLFTRHSPTFILTNWQLIIVTLSVYFNFLALIFTKSRSGILAFFAGFALMLLLQLFSWWRHRQLQASNLAALGLVSLGFFLPAAIWGTQYTPALVQSVAAQSNLIISLPQENLTLSSTASAAATANLRPLSEQLPPSLRNLDLKITDSADIRKIVWRGALAIWRAHPLFGTGAETFAYSYYNYRPLAHNWTSEWDFLYNKAHNEFLNFLANSGAFGLLTYLSLFIVLAIFTLRYLWQKDTSALLIGISSGLFALSITNFFGFSTVTVQVLLFLFLALAAQILSSSSPVEKTAAAVSFSHPMLTSKQKFSLLLDVALVIFLLNKVWTYWSADYNYALCKSLAASGQVKNTLSYCQRAISLSHGREPLYLADTADFYAQYAVALAQKDPTNTTINQVANESLRLSNLALQKNPVHLNLYKTRFRTLMTLAKLDDNALTLAQETISQALLLAPTDPKVAYFNAVLQSKLGDAAATQTWLDRALTLRPLYLEARLAAAQLATAQKNFPLAQAHYQFILDYIDSKSSIATQEIAKIATFSAIISDNENN